MDIKSAFRLMLIHPDNFELLGSKLQDKKFFYKALPFGESISSSTFEKFSTF